MLKLSLALGFSGQGATGPDVTAPTITSASSANNPENTTLAHALTANEGVTWSIIGGADQALFEISGSTLRWASNGTQDYETPLDAGTNNTYVVDVRATDGASNTADQTITITVTDVAEGSPPTDPMLMWDAAQVGYYFNNDITAMFLTNEGKANVASNGDAIGLLADVRLAAGDTFTDYVDGQTDLVDTGNTAAAWTASGTNIVADDIGESAVSVTYVDNATGMQLQLDAAGGLSGNLTSGAFYRVRSQGKMNTGTATLRYAASGSNINTTLNTTYQEISGMIVGAGGSGEVLTLGAGALSVGEIGYFKLLTLRAAFGNHARQITSGLRPTYQTGYRRYDGTDDVSPSGAVCGASGNMLWVRFIAPASVPAVMMLAGTEGAAAAGAFRVGINTSGLPCAAVGTDTVTTIVGSTDIRGLSGVLCLVEDGTDVELWWCEEGGTPNLEYTAARNGAPSTSIAVYEGAANINGTATHYAGADIAESGLFAATPTAGEIDNVCRWNNT